MPLAMEQHLFQEGRKRGLSGEKLNAFVYGTMRHHGWTPTTQHKTKEEGYGPTAKPMYTMKPAPMMEVNPRIKNYGDYNPNNEHIRINPKKGDVVNTIIHEKLHHNFPDMPHDKVYEYAARIEGSMTLPEMAHELMVTHLQSKQVVIKDRPKIWERANEHSIEIKPKSA